MKKYVYIESKEYIKANGNINASRVLERYVKNNHIELYNDINKFEESNKLKFTKYSQLLWHFINNIKCELLCDHCHKEKVKWINFKKGYSLNCSIKCSNSSKKTKDNMKNSLMKKYGVDNVSKIDKVKEKKKAVNFKRYGNEHPAKLDIFKDKSRRTNISKFGFDNAMKNEEIKKQVKSTNLKKYGFYNAMKNKEIFDKSKATNLKRYGHENPAHGIEAKKKIKNTILKKYKSEYYTQSDLHRKLIIKKKKEKFIKLLGIKNDNILDLTIEFITIKCEKCNKPYTDNSHFIHKRIKDKYEPCTNCNPRGYNESTSKGELELLEFIKYNYTGTVIEGDRKVLGRKELDIYLPDINLAFEFNGVYWHNELHKDKDYHLNKTEDCLKQNIQLIHIYEDDWLYKQEIVKSRILNLLGMSIKIYARKTEIREVSSKDSRMFLEYNHIQGNVNSRIKIGLYYNDDLVSLMTFGSLRKNLGQMTKEGSYELLRFCNSLNTTVIGGASRLFKHFKLNYLPKEIISYADRSWSKGGLYENLDFEFVKNTGVNYYYVIDGIRENRFKYRKDILVKEGYDSNMTEHNIMISRDIYRIYDSGSIKFKYNNT